MNELDKLEELLKEYNIPYERYDVSGLDIDGFFDRHQICVPERGENCQWDAICHYGSYGYYDGLLEIYGEIVDEEKDGDSVVGFLTANDVMRRVHDWWNPANRIRECMQTTRRDITFNQLMHDIGGDKSWLR